MLLGIIITLVVLVFIIIYVVNERKNSSPIDEPNIYSSSESNNDYEEKLNETTKDYDSLPQDIYLAPESTPEPEIVKAISEKSPAPIAKKSKSTGTKTTDSNKKKTTKKKTTKK